MSYSTRSTDERASHNKVNLGRILSRLDKTVGAGVQGKTWWEVRKLSEVRSDIPPSLPPVEGEQAYSRLELIWSPFLSL